MTESVKSFKGAIAVAMLPTGLPVYGRVIEEDVQSGMVAFEKPYKLTTHMISGPNGPQIMGMPEPFNPFNNDIPLVLSRSQYVQLHEAPADLEKQWLQASSGIDLGAG